MLNRLVDNTSLLDQIIDVVHTAMYRASDKGVKYYKTYDIGGGDRLRKKLEAMIRQLLKEDCPMEVDEWNQELKYAREVALRNVVNLNLIGSQVSYE